jgi:hypothetical protein
MPKLACVDSRPITSEVMLHNHSSLGVTEYSIGISIFVIKEEDLGCLEIGRSEAPCSFDF